VVNVRLGLRVYVVERCRCDSTSSVRRVVLTARAFKNGVAMNLVLGVISAVASIATIYLFSEEMRNRKQFGWKHVEKLVKALINKMQVQQYKPDVIIGIGRGGAILAGILAGNLGHVPLAVMDTIIDRSTGISSAKIRYPATCPDIRDKSVLLVVGELYSGEDLKQGMEFVKRKHPKEVRTASLLTHPAASVRPDYVGLESAKPLTAPWRITESYRMQRL
jgi:uncharacterized protein